MQPVYTFLATFLPDPDETAGECFARLADRAVRSVADQYPGGPVPKADGVTVRPAADHEVVAAREAIDPNHDLFTLDWSRPEDDGLRMTCSVELARTPLGVQARVAVRAAAGRFAAAPARADPYRPGLVDDLCREATALVGGRPVPAAVRRVSPPFVAGFVDDLLLDAGRPLPVVVLSPLPATGRPLVDPEAVLDEAFGLAHVVELTAPAATFALTDRLGKEWSCFLGAVRIYWPGLDPARDDFRRHPIFFPDHYPPGPDADRRLPADVLRRLASAAHARFADAPLIRQARAALDRKAQDALQRRIAELTVGVEQSREWQRHLEAAWDDARRLKEQFEVQGLELAEARGQLAEVRGQLNDQLEQWATVSAEIKAAQGDAAAARTGAEGLRRFALDRVRRVADAIDLARAEFPDTLQFLDDAARSAADSPYHHPRKVYDLFRALDEAMRAIRDRGQLGEPLYDRLKRAGFEYKDRISQTSEGKFGDEYRFGYAGGRRLFENHVTLGSGHNPQDCLSVHWLRDDDRRQFVVGWCGKHRTNTRS